MKMGESLGKHAASHQQVTQDFACSIARSMGHAIGGVGNQDADVDPGWASVEVQNGYVSQFPEKDLIDWDIRYRRFKVMITSLNGEIDFLHLQQG
jgi:hypothetical protein